MRVARLLCVLTLLTVPLAGCGSGGSTSATSPRPAVLIATAATLLARPPAGYTASYVVQVPSAGLAASDGGSFDFENHSSDQSLTTVGGQTPHAQEGRPVRAIVTGRLLYIEYPPQVRAGLIPKPWVSFTAAQYNAYAGHRGGLEAISNPFAYGASGTGGQIAASMFAAVKTFREVGTASVAGVSTRRYDGRLGSFTVQATIPRPFREQSGRISVWLDAGDRVRRVVIIGTGVHPSTQRYLISHWGVPRVTPPPAADVVAEPDTALAH